MINRPLNEPLQRPPKPVERPSLFEVTRTMLIRRDRTLTLERIENETGLSRSWLAYLTTRKCQDSRSQRIQKLYEYLSGNKLDY